MRAPRIVLIEDNTGDVELVREALGYGELDPELHVIHSGSEAMAYIERLAGDPAAPVPDLIFLDLNLPGPSGTEVLRFLRESTPTALTPVVVMTSSESERDIAESYRLRANCYVRKPLDFQEFQDAVREVEAFWLHRAKLPPLPRT